MASKTAAKTTKSATAKRSTTKAAAKKPAASKRSSTKAASKKPVAASKAATPIKVVPPAPDTETPTEITKRELVERVVADSGMKKGEARRAIDAVLSAMGQTLLEGKGIAAAPLGKMKLVRKKQTPNGELAVLRVKLKNPQKEIAAPVAVKAQK